MQGNRPRYCDHQRKKPGHSLQSDLPRHSHTGTSSPLFCCGNSRRRQIGGCNLHVVCQPGVRTTSRRDVLQLHRRSSRAQPSTRDRARPRTQVCVPEGTGYVPGTGYLPCGVRTPGVASEPSQESVTCSLIGRRAEAVAAVTENKASTRPCLLLLSSEINGGCNNRKISQDVCSLLLHEDRPAGHNLVEARQGVVRLGCYSGVGGGID